MQAMGSYTTRESPALVRRLATTTASKGVGTLKGWGRDSNGEPVGLDWVGAVKDGLLLLLTAVVEEEVL